MIKTALITGYSRTPFACIGGRLKDFSGTELMSLCVKEAVSKSNIPDLNLVDELLVGCTLFGGLGQAPFKEIQVLSGLPNEMITNGVHKVCASGIKSLMRASESIMVGNRDCVITGGFESMSNSPHYLFNARGSSQWYGSFDLVDACEYDGLIDISGLKMGEIGDEFAREMNISRTEQDDYAVESFKRAIKATKDNIFSTEIVPIKIGIENEIIVDTDEQIERFNEEKLRSLLPSFNRKNGYLTPGNCSPLSDGAASIIVCSEEFVSKNNQIPIAKILSFDDAELESTEVCNAGPIAVQKAIERSKGLSLSDIDFFEFHEPFSVVPIMNMKVLGVPHEICNVHGGSISLGHPLGASGSRIVVSLMNVLERYGGKYGCAVTCNGGGGASALIIESLV